jgi:hypothetical protein
MSLLKKDVRADLAGWNLIVSLIDPEDCWRAVCLLRSYTVPGPIAACEMAFVRTAIVRHAIKWHQSPEVAALMLAAGDRLIKERFSVEDTEETLAHYSNQPLNEVAPKIIQLYEENAFPITGLADLFASRLRVPGIPSIEIGPLFEEVEAAGKSMLNSVKIVP